MKRKQLEPLFFRRKWKLSKFSPVLYRIAGIGVLFLLFHLVHPLVVTLLILLFLVGWFLIAVISDKIVKQRNEKWAQQHGEPIQATVSYIDTRKGGLLERGKGKVYTIVLTWTSPWGEMYFFRRDLGRFSTLPPSLEQQYARGTVHTVYIAPGDPSCYYVRL